MGEPFGDSRRLLVDSGRAEPRHLITTGIVLLVIAALWELGNALRGAWPTVLTWLLMAVGFVIIAIGVTRTGGRAKHIAWIMVALFILALLFLWLSG